MFKVHVVKQYFNWASNSHKMLDNRMDYEDHSMASDHKSGDQFIYTNFSIAVIQIIPTLSMDLN